MDRREAIRLFVKRNLGMIHSDPFLPEVFKKTKRDFFVQYAKIGVPKDSEIAEELLEMKIMYGQVKSNGDLDKILQFPFFRENLHNTEYYYQKISMKSIQNKALIDAKGLGQAEYQEKMLKNAKREILDGYDDEFRKKEEEKKIALAKLDEEYRIKAEEKKEELAVLDQEFKKKEEEYLSFPTILDKYDDLLPEQSLLEDSSTSDKYVVWWNVLDLKDDPFPILEGLGKIGRDLWEQVIYKTSIFEKYETIVQNAPGELFKNTVFYGDFGSGKTTLFNYLSIRIGTRRIIPIYLQLYGVFDVHSLLISFRTKLLDELIQFYKIRTGKNMTNWDPDLEKAIKEILSELVREYDVEGFVVFIDELHKGDLDNALKFMSLLQAFKIEIINKLSFINIGFLIAGSLDWEKRISNDSRYSGSVSREETMPPVTVEIAHQALNLRLKAFANNPDNPRELDKVFVETIYRRLQVSGQPLNFRRIIRAALDELESGHFDGFTVNPIKIPSGTLEQIKKKFEYNQITKHQLNKLLYGSHGMNAIQKSRCLKYLIKVYRARGIYDTEIKVDEVPYYKRLFQAHLIVKALKNEQLFWVPSSAIDLVNRQVIREYNLSLEDYLLKIYGHEESQKPSKHHVQEIEIMEEFLRNLPKNIYQDLLNLAKEYHSEVLSYHVSDGLDDPHRIIKKCADSLGALTQAYLSFEHYKLPVADVLQFWKDFWSSPEELQQFIRIRDIEDMTEVKKLYPLAISLYRETFPVLFEFIRQQYLKSRQIPIPLKFLKNDELKQLNMIRDHFIATEYYDAASKLGKIIEKKLRNLLLNIFTILFGSRESRLERLDKDSRNYINKNTEVDERNGFGYATNEFQHLNRGQYKNLMTGIAGSSTGKKLWNDIFSHIFAPWTEKDLYDYLDSFAMVNIKVSHNNEGSIQGEQYGIIFNFIIKSIEFLKKTNTAYTKLISQNHIKHSRSKIVFSFCEFKDEDLVTPCEVKVEDVQKLEDKIENKTISIPLDDQEYITEYFGIDYRNFIALIAVLAGQTEEDMKRTKKKLMIEDNNNSNISIAVSSI